MAFFWNVYASGGCFENHTWQLLHRLHSFFFLPWIIGGDFNEILKLSEGLGRLPRDLKMMPNFQSVL